MRRPPTFSLIVPTRQRPQQLRRLLESLGATTARPETVEVILVVDADDPASREVTSEGLAVKHVMVPPGLGMGALNSAGYEASSGAFVMLLNDDVVARTRGWDEKVRTALMRFPDDLVLVHTNDGLFRESLCTFPLVSRTYCEMAGGICPRSFVRYRIDDHIGDVFNRLEELGEPRRVYLPAVIFEHFNYTEDEGGRRAYALKPKPLALDAPTYETLLAKRRALAQKLHDYIQLRRRQRGLAGQAEAGLKRVRACVRDHGWRGLMRAVWRRVVSGLQRTAWPFPPEPSPQSRYGQ
jgi:glycosyltransferase involved in cell wall biosynthesis